MWLVFAGLLLVINGVISQTTNDDEPSVTISQGVVVGSRGYDGDYFEFHGIPYADSTSGSSRFKAPSAPPLFETPFNANRRNIKCVRALGAGFEGTEDCLVANVMTPTLNNTANLPVIVWIKGHEFDKLYTPELSFNNFLEKDVVVVSLNFRESILGFLCLGTETAPGNAGLKDIKAGLKWIQANIIRFGGDPNNVSIFGHGSGAAIVDLITLSPKAEGLVHKAIAQSGTALAPWAVTRDNLKYAISIAEALGHIVTDIESLSEIFTRTSVSALMAVLNELDLTDNSLAFAPCLERDDLDDIEPFLTKSPYETILNGEQLQIPFMTGFVDKEGTIRAEEAIEDDWLEKMEESFFDFIQPDIAFDTDEQEVQVVDEIKHFYFGEEPIDMTQLTDYLLYHGDTMILVSAIREARMRAASSSSPIYLYQFSYKGSLAEPFEGPFQVESAAHSEELAYLFYDESNTNATQMDLTVSDILVERWTNFAKTGIPTSESSQIQWEPYTTENNNYLRILDDKEISENLEGTLEMVLVNPHPEILTFWNDIYEEHFFDARFRFELHDRDEDDDEVAIEDNDDEESEENEDEEPEDNEDEGPEDNEDEGDNENVDEDGGEDGDDDDGNSASKTVGYTLSLLTTFTMLNKFHMSRLLL